MTFENIFKENYLYIYNFALKLSCHPQDAEDLTQQTFFTAFKKFNQLKEEKALKKWLATICYNQFLMFIRKNGARIREETSTEIDELEKLGTELPACLPQPEEEVIVADQIKSLQNGCFMAMVRKLSLKQRIAFSLVDMFGIQTEYVAELLEVSSNTLKGLLFRARMNLDSFFADHCNLLDEKNPCSCAAWIRFRESHEKNQIKMKKTISYLDFEKKGYLFDNTVRAKVNYLYSHMPDQKPSDEWFSKIIEIFK